MSLDRTTPPLIKQATDFSIALPLCEHLSLGANQNLHYVNMGTQDVCSFEVYIPKLLKSRAEVAVSKAVAALLKAGTSKYTALQINEKIEQLGANIGVGQNNDYFIITLKCLQKHFVTLLPLVFEIIQDAKFPEEELEIYRQQALQHMAVNLKKSDFVANRTIDELIYGLEHPYGSYSLVEDYNALNQQAIVDFHAEYFTLNQATYFLSGKFSDAELNCISREVKSLPETQAKGAEETGILHPSETKKHRLTNDENALQGAIRVAKKFIDREHKDFVPMLFTNTLFGGYFGSRLMSNIREDKGYTYGIYSFVQQNMQANSYVVATDVGKDVAEQAVAEIWNEMKRLREEPVPAEELQLVKNYILGSIVGSIDGPFKIMSRWKSLILNGRNESHFAQSVQTYKDISAEQIQELANTYYKQEDFYDLIVY